MAEDLEEVYRRLSEIYEKQIPKVLSIIEEMRRKKGVRGMPRLFENLFRKQEEKKGPLGLPYGPVRKILSEWEPMIPDRPKVFTQEFIADTITREDAIKATAASRWAQEWAEGILRLAGVSPGEPSYEGKKRDLARKVAERLWA